MDNNNTLGIIDLIKTNKKLKDKWDMLSSASQRYLKEVDEKKRVPNLLSDHIFKKIFDPEVNPDQLSKLISSVLGRELTVKRVLDKEGIMLSEDSKGIIMDVPVEFSDGSMADVEIQRRGVDMPPQRSAVYSANMLTSQYTKAKGQNKSEIDYESVRPVFTIIIMEKSPDMFHNNPDYHHHFCQTSNTGVEKNVDFELLQYYDYICLDVFKKQKPHIATMLEKWLKFFSIQKVDEMIVFLSDYPEFEEAYMKAVEMMRDKDDLYNIIGEMFASEDIVASLNKTNKSKIKRLSSELAESKKELAERNQELAEVGQALAEKDQALAEKDRIIAELMAKSQ